MVAHGYRISNTRKGSSQLLKNEAETSLAEKAASLFGDPADLLRSRGSASPDCSGFALIGGWTKFIG